MKNLIVTGAPQIKDTHLIEVSLASVLKAIRTDQDTARTVKRLRGIEDKADRQAYKAQHLKYFVGATFDPPERKSANLKSAEILIFDVDGLPEEEKYDLREQLQADRRTLFCFESPSGNGLKFAFHLEEPITHPQHFVQVYEAYRRELEQQYSIGLDHTSDPARACYLSHDPDLFENPAADRVPVPDFEQGDEQPNPPADAGGEGDKSRYAELPADIDAIVTHLAEHLEGYDPWYKAGLALAAAGEEGREPFIKLSINNPRYPNETRHTAGKKFDDLLRERNGTVGMGTLLFIAAQFGYKPTRVPRNEDAVAEYFVYRHEGKAIYCKAFNRWYLWTGNHWEADRKSAITDLARSSVEDYAALGEQISDTGEKIKFGNFINSLRSKRRQDSILDNASARAGIRVSEDDLDNAPNLFNTASGTIDLDGLDFAGDTPVVPFKTDPKNYLTMASDVRFDPNAECPQWESFLQTWFAPETGTEEQQRQGRELIDYMQRAVGYSLSGYTSENALFFLFGHGKNGKSTFFEAVKRLMGDYAWRVNAETLMAQQQRGVPNDVAALKGRRFVSSSELEEGQRWREGLVKSLSGSDTLNARFLFGEEFQFKPELKLWLAGNHKPRLANSDHGIQRRIKLVPFLNKIPDHKLLRAEKIERIIEDELSGILNWALFGYWLWRTEGLREPIIVRKSTEEYFLQEDMIQQFLDERCDVADPESPTESSLLQVLASDLYKTYQQYAEGNSEKYPVRRNKFYEALEGKGFKKERKTGNKYYIVGLKLQKSDDEQPDYWQRE